MTPAEVRVSIARRLDALVASGALTYVRAVVLQMRAYEAGNEARRAMEPTS